MSLRAKVFLPVIAALLLTVAVLYRVASGSALRAFGELERQEVGEDTDRALAGLEREQRVLMARCGDWSDWDETIAFVEGRQPAFGPEYLTPKALTTLGIQAVMFLDRTGRLVASAELNEPARDRVQPSVLVRHAAELAFKGPTPGTRAGLLLTAHGPMLFCARSIRDNLGGGPSRGTLVFAERLDARMITQLGHDCGLDLTAYALGGPLPEPIAQVVTRLGSGRDPLIFPLDRQYVLGYRLAFDLTGQAALVLRVQDRRDQYQQGLRSLRGLLINMLLGGLIPLLVLLALIERLVVRRIGALTGEVARIGREVDLAGRVSLTGSDEVGDLAGRINGMLTALGAARDENERLVGDLRARVAEMRVLSQAAITAQRLEAEPGEVLAAVARALPDGCCRCGLAAELRLGEQVYRSDNWRPGPAGAVVCCPTLAGPDLELAVHATRGAPLSDEATALVQRVGDVLQGYLDRRHLSASLQASEQRARRLVELSPNGIMIGVGGQVSFANQQAAVVLGSASAEALVGRGIVEFVSPDDRPALAASLAAAEQGAYPPLTEARVLRLDGGFRDVEFLAVPFAIDGAPGIQLVFGDVTAQRHAEQVMRLLATAIEQCTESIVITDPDWQVEYTNPAFHHLTGYPPAQVLGQPLSLIDMQATEVGAQRALIAALRQDCPWSGQMVLRRRSGELVDVAVSVSPVLDDQGKVTRHVAVGAEITQQRRLEDRLRQTSRLEAIGQLAGGVAHDFNNILTTIIGYTDLLLGDPTQPARDDLEQIREAAGRAASLTQQLLAFGRKQALQPRVIDVNAVVAAEEDMLRRMIREDITFEVRPSPTPLPALADEAQIEQVVLNLVVNARDATPPGGTITVRCESTVVDEAEAAWLGGLQPGPHVVIVVEDNGEGIAPDALPHIFEPFFTTKALGRGTGLGLATVYGIVKQSGGEVLVDSRPGVGTTFRVYLALAEGEVSPLAEVVPLTPAPRGHETILLVEDDPSVRGLTVRMLRAHGYQVLLAGSPGEALLIAERQEQPIDLMLSDVVMPLLSGPHLAERVRRLRPGLPVLLMSGYPTDALAAQGLHDTDLPLLPKPFCAEDLTNRLRDVLATTASG